MIKMLTEINQHTAVNSQHTVPKTFRFLKDALNDGTYREKFPIGTPIPDVWTDPTTSIIYPMVRIIVDYRTVELAGREHRLGAILLSQTVVPPDDITFDDRGSIIFAKSTLRMWLNGDDPDCYLAGCNPELLDTVAEVMIDGALVKFFPPSLEELHLDPHKNPKLENLTWEYFRDMSTDYHQPCSKRIFRAPLSAMPMHVWLRSALRGYSDLVWGADTDGSAYYYYAYTAGGACAPACVII